MDGFCGDGTMIKSNADFVWSCLWYGAPVVWIKMVLWVVFVVGFVACVSIIVRG